MKQTFRARYPIADLEPHPRNPKPHEDVSAIVESIEHNDFFGAVLVQQSRSRIIAGHGTVKAAAETGRDHVPVILVDVDDDQALKMLLAANRVAELSLTDDELLAAILGEMDDLTGTGYSDLDADRLAAIVEAAGDSLPGAGGAAPDDVPETRRKRRTRPGDVWRCGDHVVVCGDATDPATVAQACDGTLARMVWTDPPYGIDYEGKTAERLTITNDGADGLRDLLERAVRAFVQNTEPGCAVYVASPGILPNSLVFAQVLTDADLFRQRLVWVKNVMVMGRSDYHYQHEDLYFGYTPSPAGSGRRGRMGGSRWFGGNDQTTTLFHDRPSASKQHPTMKPVSLIEQCIRNSSAPGDLILDPFGGSGSTLIAAENTSRRAALVELDPMYVDVIVDRWQAVTGQEPTRHH